MYTEFSLHNIGWPVEGHDGAVVMVGPDVGAAGQGRRQAEPPTHITGVPGIVGDVSPAHETSPGGGVAAEVDGKADQVEGGEAFTQAKDKAAPVDGWSLGQLTVEIIQEMFHVDKSGKYDGLPALKLPNLTLN